MTGRWLSPGTLATSTNKSDRHDITEILLKVALNTITLTLTLKNTTYTEDYQLNIHSCPAWFNQFRRNHFNHFPIGCYWHIKTTVICHVVVAVLDFQLTALKGHSLGSNSTVYSDKKSEIYLHEVLFQTAV